MTLPLPRGWLMEQVSRAAPQAVNLKAMNSQSTTAFGDKPQPSTPSWRRIALVPGTSGQLTDELTGLLRRRLRVAGLIALAGFATFLVKGFIAPPSHPMTPRPLDVALNALVVAVMTALCALLWSRIPFGMRG